MKRRDFIRTIAVGAAAAPLLGQTSCAEIALQGDAISKSKDSGAGKPATSGKPYRDRNWPELFPPAVTDIDPNDTTVLLGDAGELGGGMSTPWNFQLQPGNYVTGWTTPNGLSISWTVNAPQEMDCTLALIYACAGNSVGSKYEIASQTAGYVGYDYDGRKVQGKVTGVTRKTNGWWPEQNDNWQNFDRDVLTETLHIPAGLSVIRIRATSMPSQAKAVMVFRAIELTPKCAEPAIAAAKQRALKLRGNTQWFADAKYGLMFHWTAHTPPHHGQKKPFDQAVRDFDVNRFADMVKETGAGYCFFFFSHGIYWVPAPIRTVEEILPGRTCERDLIGDVADALEKRGVKLLLYYNPSYYDDVDWRIAAGWGPVLRRQSEKDVGIATDWRKTKFYENESRIVEEVSKRYGKRVWGFWFDDIHPFQLFEKQTTAAKVGNPDAIVGYNSWLFPKWTEFQDFFAAEWGCSPVKLTADYFAEGGPQGGMQPHGTVFIDGAWHVFMPEQDIKPQRFTEKALIDFTKYCVEKKTVLTLNMCIYQDGEVSPETLAKMKALRKAIRGA